MSSPLRTYRGNCHCGAFVYEADLPEITKATECPCYICRKKGYLLVDVDSAAHFRVVKGSLEDLSEYRFGSRQFGHRFCPVCATALLGQSEPGAVPGSKDMFLNVHAIQGLNTWTLTREPVDGTGWSAPYEEPKHGGAMPAEVEGGKLYTGSCHCGKLTVAVHNKPLEDDKDSGMVQCNCSICERNAYLWVYPKKEHVVLHGRADDIGHYTFADKILAKTFCKTCGVNMTNPLNERITKEEEAALSDKARGYVRHHVLVHPVNVRTLHGVDFSRLHVKNLDGMEMFGAAYVNP